MPGWARIRKRARFLMAMIGLWVHLKGRELTTYETPFTRKVICPDHSGGSLQARYILEMSNFVKRQFKFQRLTKGEEGVELPQGRQLEGEWLGEEGIQFTKVCNEGTFSCVFALSKRSKL